MGRRDQTVGRTVSRLTLRRHLFQTIRSWSGTASIVVQRTARRDANSMSGESRLWTSSASGLSRRRVLRLGGMVGAAAGSAVLAGCGTRAAGSSRASAPIRIGFVSPQTGPLSNFAASDSFVVDSMRARFSSGVQLGSVTRPLQVIVRDSRSTAEGAAAAAEDLVKNEKIDLMLVSSTPDTTNPVADVCEKQAVPCISTCAPWEPYFFGRGGNPDTPFKWTFHYFFGMADIAASCTALISAVPTNRRVGALWPADPDGSAWRDPKTGFGPILAKAGFTLIDPGPYQDGTNDFGPLLRSLKDQDAQILLALPIPPDAPTILRQAAQIGYRPKVAFISKAVDVPGSIQAVGPLGQNVGIGVYWSPKFPFTSSLTRQTAAQLAEEFERTTGQQWLQILGCVHALFEVAIAALSSAGTTDKHAVADRLRTLSVNTIAGPVNFATGPVRGVSAMPAVSAQWRRDQNGRWEPVIVAAPNHPELPTESAVQPFG
ncbi:ABC transporter substrate-binding protein [Planosporangium sp. 12N6]|uniref:ABC transporter substrate-binding protein n=1 Tax=Planosporangium spinosum TaxID=3402278 RepID=UPI003CF886F5